MKQFLRLTLVIVQYIWLANIRLSNLNELSKRPAPSLPLSSAQNIKLSKSQSKIRYSSIIFVALATAIFLTACSSGDANDTAFDPESSLIATLDISSVAFEDGESIPSKYTCDGDNTSPPLRWSDVPAGTRSIAILVDDPDAPSGIFRHWSVYNIPSGNRSLPAEQSNTVALKDSIRQATNDFGTIGYGGPCPPRGEEHEYVFFIYALSEPLDLDDDATALDVSAALRGKVVGTGSFSGMYARR